MNPQIDSRIRTLTVLLVALIVGMLGFGAISIAMKGVGEWMPQERLASTLLVVLAGMVVVESPMLLVVRKATESQLRTRLESPPQSRHDVTLINGYFASVLIPAALLEGFGLFGTIIHLITGCALGLIAPVLACAGIALLFPSRDKYEQFAERITRKAML